MYDVFIAIGAIGHVVLWVALVNRLHGLAIKRKLMHAVTAACGVAVVAIPPLVFMALAQRWKSEGPLPQRGIAANLAWSYVLGCAAVGLVSAAVRLRELLHPERRGTVIANHTTRCGLRASAAEPFAAPGVPAWLAGLPGNQVFDLHVHEKQLIIPRMAPAQAGLRIAHLSDLHMSGRIRPAYFREMVERVNERGADLIAITGDLVERNVCLDWIPETLGRLRAPGGVYFVLGNHDLKVDQKRLMAGLADAGLVHVGGREILVTVGDRALVLAGNELPWYGPAPNCEATRPPNEVDRTTSTPRILLAHSPDQFAWAQENAFDLMLAGHNHGGQVRLPLFGAILAPSRHGVRYAHGVFRGGRTVLHVSRGTASLTPFRFNCPPEIALLELHSKA